MIAKPPSIQQIVCVTADYFNVTAAQIVSAHRHQHICLPRHVAMYLSRILTKSSLEKIGDVIGGRDHSTVFHAVERIGAERQTDATLAAQIDALETSLRPREESPQVQYACA